MKKRMWLAGSIVLLLILTACGAKASPTEQAKATVEGFYQALSKMEFSKMKQYFPKEVREQKNDIPMASAETPTDQGTMETSGGTVNVAQQMETMKKFLSTIKATYESGEIAEGAKEGTLTYKVESPSMMDYMQKLALTVGPDGQPDYTKIDETSFETETNTVAIDVKEETGKWVLSDPQSLFMKALGVQGDPMKMLEKQ